MSKLAPVTCIYDNKRYKVVDVLPHGNYVLQRWVKGEIPTIFGWGIPYIYRGVIIVSPDKVEMA